MTLDGFKQRVKEKIRNMRIVWHKIHKKHRENRVKC